MTPAKLITVIVGLSLLVLGTSSVRADSAAQLRSEGRAGLNRLYSINPKARALGQKARAVLVFPKVTKAGFVIGGQRGDGVLFVNGSTAGYYNTSAVSYGLQAGAQTFGYALFFMDDGSLSYLRKSDGWEIGVGPSVVVVDEGMAKTFSTTTIEKGIYAFIFHQKGLMAGLGLQGTKITKYRPSE